MSDQAVNVEVVEDEETGEGFLPPSAKANTTLAVQAREDRLLEKVLDSGNIEILERFIRLRNDEEERQAKQEFERHFAEMQADLGPVKKSTEAYDEVKNRHMYNYASLDAIQKACDPIIHKHGFSYRWREEALEDGAKRTTLVISGYGHTDDTTYFDAPKITGTQYTNAIQVAGQMSTYGRRYTYTAGFGIITEDEDNDGSIEGVGERFADEVKLLNDAETLQAVMAVWREDVYPKVKNDPGALKYLTNELNLRKKAVGGK